MAQIVLRPLSFPIFPLFWLAAYNKQNVWTPEGWYVWEDHDKEMSAFIDVIKSQEWPDD